MANPLIKTSKCSSEGRIVASMFTKSQQRYRGGYWGSPLSGNCCHSAKGFEFDTVILPQCAADYMPDAKRLNAFASRTEGLAQEARLLYVSLSRARTRLVLTYTGDLTPLLPQDISLYDWVER